MSKERNLGQRVKQGLRVAKGFVEAGIFAAGGLLGANGIKAPDVPIDYSLGSRLGISQMLEPQTASAQLLKPPIHQGVDGRLTTILPFETPGKGYIVTSKTGLEFFNAGNGLNTPGELVYGENVKVAITSDFGGMNIGVRVRGCGELSTDVIANVGGNNYPTRAAAIMRALSNEMNPMDPVVRTTWSEVGMILTKDYNQNEAPPELIGGSKDLGIRGPAVGCPTGKGEVTPPPFVAPAPAPRVEVVAPPPAPIVPAGPEGLWCPPSVIAGRGTPFEIRGANGKPVMRVYGARDNARTGIDIADHAPFVSGIADVMNVLAEPGALNRHEDLRAGVNFFNFDSANAAGLNRDASGQARFDLQIGKHRIVKADAEELCLELESRERRIVVDLAQYSLGPGGQAHHSFFVRSPYFDGARVTLHRVTAPGTQLQIVGQEGSAFASEGAFRQGVPDRQNRRDYPNYIVSGVNANDLTIGAAQSTAPGQPFGNIGSNYR